MDGLVMAAQLILGLSILVVLHELGHFLPAKWFKTKVDKFYLFFDFLFPLPEVAKFSLFKFKKGDTEYGIGWFPLGGYVKIDGMIDESMDQDYLKNPPQPWEFRAKPAWQRFIIMIGGVTVNVVTGVIIFIAITYIVGERFIPAKEVKYGIVAHPMAQDIGLKTGDKIVKINGKPYERFSDILSADVLLESHSYYTVLRNGQEINIPIPLNFLDKISDKKNQGAFADPIAPFSVGKVMDDSPAKRAGLLPGDKIVAIDSTPISFFHELQSILKEKKNKVVSLKIERADRPLLLKATISPEAKLGFYPELLLKDSLEKYSLAEAIPKGTVKAFGIIVVQLKAFKKMFSGELDVSKSLSGPIGIAKEFGGNWDWLRFWSLTGMLSMVLAFMNILPIPALDGGHVVFILYELLTRRKPSIKFLEATQRVGMAILLLLMGFAIFNDVSHLF